MLPSAALVRGSDGAFYGTTYAGTDFDGGVVFRLEAHNPSPAR